MPRWDGGLELEDPGTPEPSNTHADNQMNQVRQRKTCQISLHVVINIRRLTD